MPSDQRNAKTPGNLWPTSERPSIERRKNPMPPPRERRWPRIAAGYIILLLVLGGITAFAFETAGPAYQPLVLRLAVALLLAVVLLHIRSHFRGDPLWDPPSTFENALAPERVAPKFDGSLVKLRGELADSLKRREEAGVFRQSFVAASGGH